MAVKDIVHVPMGVTESALVWCLCLAVLRVEESRAVVMMRCFSIVAQGTQASLFCCMCIWCPSCWLLTN
jgi:hypothetical protein